MRTVLSTEDIRNIVEAMFNGNLRQSELSHGAIEYDNPNSETIVLVDEDGEQEQFDLAKYLNIHFYAWKNRLVEKNGENIPFDAWVDSLNFSLNESYALVETVNEEVVASQDIDSATKACRITFLVQTNKIENLDYYVAKIKSHYIGNPQDIINSFGDTIKSYITLGVLLYEDEPIQTQLGEVVVATLNFKISYLNDALTYSDIQVQISLDNGETYLTMPLSKITWQNMFNENAVPTMARPDLTGFVATSVSTVKTLTFFDFNKELTRQFNTLFWRQGAYKVGDVLVDPQDVNIPIFIRIITGGVAYTYKDMISQMEKVISNNDFNISSITLKGYGKVGG